LMRICQGHFPGVESGTIEVLLVKYEDSARNWTPGLITRPARTS